MNLDDAKRLLAQADADARSMPAATDAEILAMLKAEAARFDRTIRRRDRIETIAAVFVALVFLPQLWWGSWLTRLGVVLFVAGSVLTYVRLSGARRDAPSPDMTAPVVEMIRGRLDSVDAQIRLLESVFWWYLAPLGLGVILIFAGGVGASLAALVYTAVVVAAVFVIYRLNQRAVRLHLQPLRDELVTLLADAET